MKIKITFTLLFLSAMLLSCGGKSHQTEPILYDNPSAIEQSVPDTTTIRLKKETPKAKEKSSAPTRSSSSSTSSSSTTSRSHQSSSSDNMRGFDPASEDDMDDNGMSRYMDNNDEEGWD